MKRIFLYIALIMLFTIISCDKNNSDKLSSDDYNNAAKHLNKNLKKFMFNVLSSNEWDNEDYLFYSIKGENNIKNFKIDLKKNTKTIQIKKTKKTIFTNKNNEFISPNGQLSAFINNYNLWVRDLNNNKTIQLTFDGEKDYGYATNNAGWIKTEGPVLKWSPNSDKIATFRQDAIGVGEMHLTTTNVGHPKLKSWKYALPGDKKIFEIERIIIDYSF